jgi:hypothetical protein
MSGRLYDQSTDFLFQFLEHPGVFLRSSFVCLENDQLGGCYGFLSLFFFHPGSCGARLGNQPRGFFVGLPQYLAAFELSLGEAL